MYDPSGKLVHENYTPLNPLLYSKIGVYRGIPIFLIFAPIHRLPCDSGYSLEPPHRGGSNMNPQLMFEPKY